MQTTALFTGSFDPFTKGHADIVKRALSVFGKLIIGIGINESKRTMFSPEERLQMIQTLYKDTPEVDVKCYSGLTVDFAREAGATCLLRSIRSVKDYEYELSMADVNRELSGIDTLILFTDPSLAHISSSMVRELIHFGKDVSSFLPEGLSLKRNITTLNEINK